MKPKKIKEIYKRVLVPPGRKVSLKDYDPDYTGGLDINEDEARAKLREGIEELAELQDMLYAQDRYALLVVLQALDAAGKDGTIKHVMSGINPQGCEVHSFKAPSEEELDHDYLWRCMRRLPERGRIGIFNRSYYEEVLVVRVHPQILESQKIPDEYKTKEIFRRRYEQINNFEQYLVENGTRVLKIYLNVSREEQKARFLQRIDKPEKNWKFSAADVKERSFWPKYREAYEDCFTHTSTKWAPWHIVPADFKPFARLVVSQLIVRELQSMNLHYPKVSNEQLEELRQARTILENEGKR